MITVTGVEEVNERLDRLAQRLTDDKVKVRALAPGMEKLRRFALSISPEVTGAYKAAHTVEVGGRFGRLFNDIRYVGAVEGRYRVYARTYEEAKDVGKEITKDLLEEVLK